MFKKADLSSLEKEEVLQGCEKIENGARASTRCFLQGRSTARQIRVVNCVRKMDKAYENGPSVGKPGTNSSLHQVNVDMT